MLFHRPLNAILLFGALVFSSCKLMPKEKEQRAENKIAANDTAITDGHPAWILQGNIYEVNLRQYTKAGTIKAFEKSLDRLKEMGVQTLWFMPVTPISKQDRKGALGSYYAVADYTAVNPEYGTIDDWKSFVTKAHGMGFKVIIDWVANHTGADHSWLQQHPDFFVKDSVTGKPLSPFDWTDARKLDYNNVAMQDSMIKSMEYWLTTGIDGFRCDVAGEVPDAFWTRCIRTLKSIKPGLFMLAEGDKPDLHKAGFDASYPWATFSMMKKVAAGERFASALDSIRNNYDSTYPANAIKMFFTSNHDENSWNKADYGTMPGAIHAPFAVFTQTTGRSVPLIYSGQEEPVTDSISFFYKDTIRFGKYSRAKFYQTLLHLRTSNAALAANATFTRVNAGNEKAIYAYSREAGSKKILVILNLSANAEKAQLTEDRLFGEATNVFAGAKEMVNNKPFTIEPWGYIIYAY